MRSSALKPRSRPLHVAAGAFVFFGVSSCLAGDYERLRTFQPPTEAAIDALVIGSTDVGEAVEQLGAPLHVVEVGLGLALAWGWTDTTAWNLELSVPIGDAGGSFKYADSAATTHGLVLFFDDAWQLVATRRGYLGELLPSARAPRDVDIDIADAGG